MCPRSPDLRATCARLPPGNTLQGQPEVIAYCVPEMRQKDLAVEYEDRAYWLEKQWGLIEKMGLPPYLQSQMGSTS